VHSSQHSALHALDVEHTNRHSTAHALAHGRNLGSVHHGSMGQSKPTHDEAARQKCRLVDEQCHKCMEHQDHGGQFDLWRELLGQELDGPTQQKLYVNP